MVTIPIHKAIRPQITLAAIYSIDRAICELIPKLKASREKVENVVKPPQKPVTNKAFNLGLMYPCF